MTRTTQKEQATTTLQNEIIEHLPKFYQCNLWLSVLDWESKCGDNIHHTVLSSATGLESPKSLASAEHLCWIRFRRSAELSGFHLFCVNLLVHDLSFTLQY